jgi:hypothetical protein
MEAVSGKAAHISLLGFIYGSGFVLYKWADDCISGRRRSTGSAPEKPVPSVGTADAATRSPSSFRGALRLAGMEGCRTAVGLGLGTAVAMSFNVARHGRYSRHMTSAASDPVGAGLGTFAACLVLFDQEPTLRARMLPAAGMGAAMAGFAWWSLAEGGSSDYE